MSHLSLPIQVGKRLLVNKVISVRPGIFTRALHPSTVLREGKQSDPPEGADAPTDPKEKLKQLLKRVKTSNQVESEAEVESKFKNDVLLV
jgi:hypothetical protein